MAYTDQATLAKDATFLARVQQAIVTAAIQVKAEAITIGNHNSRQVFATKVLMDPTGYALLMAQGVTQNAAVSAGSTDNDIQFTVNSIFDAYAVQ